MTAITQGKTEKQKHNMRILDRSTKEDAFELHLSQFFVGPHEVELPRENHKQVITFTYGKCGNLSNPADKNRPWGKLKVNFIDHKREEKCLSILFCHIMDIKLQPVSRVDGKGLLIIEVGEEARKDVRMKLNIGKEYIMKNFNLNIAAAVNNFKYLMFVYSPWNGDITYVVKMANTHKFQSYFRLCDKLQNWFQRVRSEDVQFVTSNRLFSVSNKFSIETANRADILQILNYLRLFPKVNQHGNTLYEYKSSNSNKKIKTHVTSIAESSPDKNSLKIEDSSEKITLKKVAIQEGNHNKNGPVAKRRKSNIQTLIEFDSDSEKINENLNENTPLVNYGSGKEKISLIFGDVNKLAPDQLLNDNIIEFFLRFLLKERFNAPPLQDKIYLYSTYFFSKLVHNFQNKYFVRTSRGLESRKAWIKRNYETGLLKKWTRNVDIFSKKFLIIPVNFEEHWYLIIVMNPGHSVFHKSEEKTPHLVTPDCATTIFIFNSLKNDHCQVTNIAGEAIKYYLLLEFEDKSQNKDLYVSPEHIKEVKVVNIASQINLSDCGVFLLAYTEMFITCTPPPKVYKNFVFNFHEFWPYFQRTIFMPMRYKILAALRQQVNKNVWHQLKSFEERENGGKSVEVLLKEELKAGGIRRWHSQVDIRVPIVTKKRIRTKSEDRKYGDEFLDNYLTTLLFVENYYG